MMKTAIGIFQDRPDVESAIDKFKREGFRPEEFLLLMRDAHQADEIFVKMGINLIENLDILAKDLSPEARDYFLKQVKDGSLLLALQTRENQLDLVMTIFDDCNALDIKTLSQSASEDTHKAGSFFSDFAHMGMKGGVSEESGKKHNIKQ